ncbi:hypothetical protein PMAYCL1PPCAC_10368, partial [Pristionchus mayeri]
FPAIAQTEDLMDTVQEVAVTKPRLKFHRNHGTSVQVFTELHGHVAARINSFCDALCFSDRPISIGESVGFFLVDLSIDSPSTGKLRVGVTYVAPARIESMKLFDLAQEGFSEDVMSSRDFRIAPIPNWDAEFGDRVGFSVSRSGDVHYSINYEYKGILLSGLRTDSEPWAVIDVSGIAKTIEFDVTPLVTLSANTTRSNQAHGSREVKNTNPASSIPALNDKVVNMESQSNLTSSTNSSSITRARAT